MSAASIAKHYLQAALTEAKAEGSGEDAVTRAMLSAVIAKYLEYRSVADVRAELEAAADNCDPDKDFPFMRP